MTDYKKMYFELAGKVADAVELLTQAQQESEKEYMESEETRPIWFTTKGNEGDK